MVFSFWVSSPNSCFSGFLAPPGPRKEKDGICLKRLQVPPTLILEDLFGSKEAWFLFSY